MSTGAESLTKFDVISSSPEELLFLRFLIAFFISFWLILYNNMDWLAGESKNVLYSFLLLPANLEAILSPIWLKKYLKSQ